MNKPIQQTSIINSASNLFYKNGYSQTTIDEIVQEANVSKTIFDNFFASKQEICIAHLRYRNEEFTKAVVSFVNQAPIGKGKILALFEYMELFFRMDDFNGCWNIKAFSEVPKEETMIREEIMLQKQGLLAFIEKMIGDNFIIDSKTDPKVLARQIYLVLESAVTESNLHQDQWPISSAKKLCSHLLDPLKPRNI